MNCEKIQYLMNTLYSILKFTGCSKINRVHTCFYYITNFIFFSHLHGSPSLACWISLGVQVWLLVLVYPPLGVGSVMMMIGGAGVVVVGVVVVVGISPSKQEASSGLLKRDDTLFLACVTRNDVFCARQKNLQTDIRME